jgi:hypothetical protein
VGGFTTNSNLEDYESIFALSVMVVHAIEGNENKGYNGDQEIILQQNILYYKVDTWRSRAQEKKNQYRSAWFIWYSLRLEI